MATRNRLGAEISARRRLRERHERRWPTYASGNETSVLNL